MAVAVRLKDPPVPPTPPLTFLEFFAGGGMARLGLGASWRCLFANDFDPMKREAYGRNFGLSHHCGEDIERLSPDDLPPLRADLAWASSPCQDLSLAGARGGLSGARSGAFFGFWRLVERLDAAGRAPRAIVIENVAGLLTSNDGEDFRQVVALMAAKDYFVGALVLNADSFVPQSRPRLFIIATQDEQGGVSARARIDQAAPQALHDAVARLAPAAMRRWRWIAARPVAGRNAALIDMIDDKAAFDEAKTTDARLAAMSARQRAAIDALARSGGRHVGAAFRRVRTEGGEKCVRIEARFDGVAGCIRTPAGGSSRQIIFDIDAGVVRSRLMTPREAARVMGLPDSYALPPRATAALKLIGDGVAPPVVAWLARAVLEPSLLRARAAA